MLDRFNGNEENASYGKSVLGVILEHVIMSNIRPIRRTAPNWLLKPPKEVSQPSTPQGGMFTPTPTAPVISQKEDFHFFFDDESISDEIHDRVFLSKFEMDVIDTPEFRRLFRVSQLGFVELLYPTANHTRGVHSIGACGLAKYLISIINENTRRIYSERLDKPCAPQISETSSILIALGALLHDLSHGPLSHDIEKKTHKLLNEREIDEQLLSFRGPYSKHDDLEKNPALYLMLTDRNESVLARVLHAYSPAFCEFMWIEAELNEASHWELKPLIDTIMELKEKNPAWDYRRELLPQLLIHLLGGERASQFDDDGCLCLTTAWGEHAKAEPWGLGPVDDRVASQKLHQCWYQPFRHDIICNTISADLLDYIVRDTHRLGLPCNMDDRFLNCLILERWRETNGVPKYCCTLDITDYKRGVARLEAITDVFRLLDIRFDIHKKAILHRVVQAAIAMMWRAIALLPEKKKPKENELYDWSVKGGDGLGRARALAGDERFRIRLLAKQPPSTKDAAALKLAAKVVERRLYKPLLVIPGDLVPSILGVEKNERNGNEDTVRELAALVDSRYFDKFFRTIERGIEDLLAHALDFDNVLKNLESSAGASEAHNFLSKRVIFWVLPYKQLYKDPLIRISFLGERTSGSGHGPTALEDVINQDGWGENLSGLLRAGIQNADAKYRAAWTASVFASDGLFYTGILAKVKPSACRSLDDHEKHLEESRVLSIAALRTAWNHWTGSLHESRQRWLDNGEGKTIHPLDSEPTSEAMKSLLKMVTHEDMISNARHVSNRVPSVAFSHYLHEPPKEGILAIPESCRDVRYKFDFDRLLPPNNDPQLEKQLEDIVAVLKDDGAVQDNVKRLLKFVNEEEQLTRLEAEDIMARFVDLPRERADRILAPLNSSGSPSRQITSELAAAILTSLWRES